MTDMYRKTALIEAYHYPFAENVPQKFKNAIRIVDGVPTIATMEGDSYFVDDCWIAMGPDGEFWRIANEVFTKTYEKV